MDEVSEDGALLEHAALLQDRRVKMTCGAVEDCLQPMLCISSLPPECPHEACRRVPCAVLQGHEGHAVHELGCDTFPILRATHDVGTCKLHEEGLHAHTRTLWHVCKSHGCIELRKEPVQGSAPAEGDVGIWDANLFPKIGCIASHTSEAGPDMLDSLGSLMCGQLAPLRLQGITRSPASSLVDQATVACFSIFREQQKLLLEHHRSFGAHCSISYAICHLLQCLAEDHAHLPTDVEHLVWIQTLGGSFLFEQVLREPILQLREAGKPFWRLFVALRQDVLLAVKNCPLQRSDVWELPEEILGIYVVGHGTELCHKTLQGVEQIVLCGLFRVPLVLFFRGGVLHRGGNEGKVLRGARCPGPFGCWLAWR
mmetsp:Transcript_44126/g.99446  ORF Transcript_44126/g.99446 Transcript_44126/m.99446 type:complete len:369 (-) Transcript_44126:90-1196(-)